MLISLILISIEKPGTKIKKKNAHLNFDLKWVNVTLLLHFFENHPCTVQCAKACKGKAGLAPSTGQNLQFRLLSGGGLLVAFLRDFHS